MLIRGNQQKKHFTWKAFEFLQNIAVDMVTWGSRITESSPVEYPCAAIRALCKGVCGKWVYSDGDTGMHADYLLTPAKLGEYDDPDYHGWDLDLQKCGDLIQQAIPFNLSNFWLGEPTPGAENDCLSHLNFVPERSASVIGRSKKQHRLRHHNKHHHNRKIDFSLHPVPEKSCNGRFYLPRNLKISSRAVTVARNEVCFAIPMPCINNITIPNLIMLPNMHFRWICVKLKVMEFCDAWNFGTSISFSLSFWQRWGLLVPLQCVLFFQCKMQYFSGLHMILQLQ